MDSIEKIKHFWLGIKQKSSILSIMSRIKSFLTVSLRVKKNRIDFIEI